MSGESAFVVLIGLCCFIVLLFAMIESSQKQQEEEYTKLLDVCRIVEGHVVEDMCIKDNRIIYREGR